MFCKVFTKSYMLCIVDICIWILYIYICISLYYIILTLCICSIFVAMLQNDWTFKMSLPRPKSQVPWVPWFWAITKRISTYICICLLHLVYTIHWIDMAIAIAERLKLLSIRWKRGRLILVIFRILRRTCAKDVETSPYYICTICKGLSRPIPTQNCLYLTWVKSL